MTAMLKREFISLEEKNSKLNLITNIRIFRCLSLLYGGARGVMVTVVGNGHGDTSSNPGRD